MFDESAFAGMDIDAVDAKALGRSPDGLGAIVRPVQEFAPSPWVEAPTPATPGYGGPSNLSQAHVPAMPNYGGYGPRQPLSGKAGWLEPDDTSAGANVRSAGISVLFLAASFGVGVALGGPWGAAAGVMLAGTVMNSYRAQKWWASADPSERYEAVTSAVFAVGGLAAGGYAAYKAYQGKIGKNG